MSAVKAILENSVGHLEKWKPFAYLSTFSIYISIGEVINIHISVQNTPTQTPLEGMHMQTQQLHKHINAVHGLSALCMYSTPYHVKANIHEVTFVV